MNKKELIARILEKMDESDLQEILGVEEEDKVSQHEIKPKRRGNGYNKKNKRPRGERKEQSKIEEGGTKFVNKFDDMLKNMQLTSAEKEEFKTLEKIDDAPARQKPKRESSLVEAQCTVCNKKETVSRSLIVGDRYRCNSCCCNAR